MQVVRLSTLAELESWNPQWGLLARGVPFRRYEWLSNWWRHYGQSSRGRATELYTLAVIEGTHSLVALAPWRIERTASLGRAVKFLGDGEVCSEYPSLLCRVGDEDRAARALAQWMTQQAALPDGPDRWDILQLNGMETDDLALARLLDHLAEQGNIVHRSPGLPCWRLRLPASWEQYLAMISKSHRKQLRQLDRTYFRSGRAMMHWVHRPAELARALDILVDLHERRWRRRGRPGCFASARFLDFHREVAPRLLARDSLRMSWLELDGAPVAAEYHLAGAGIVYAYQCGIAPEALQHQPGRLSNMATIRRAIERGDQWFDFLRGDEPYKAHWRAVCRGTVDAIVLPSRMSAQIRYGVWSAGESLLGWLKLGWQMAGNFGGE